MGRYQFKPAWLTSLLTVMLLPVFIGLGIWQLQRAQVKQQIQDEFAARRGLPELTDLSKIRDWTTVQYRSVRLTGGFDPDHTVLIDNKIYQGKAGYQVAQAFRIKDQNQSIMVNRGWIPLGKSRQELPPIATPDTEVTISGILTLAHQDVVNLSGINRSNTGWPALVRWIDVAMLQEETGLALLPGLVLANPESPGSFVCEWPLVNSAPEKSVSYAMQWFSFALLLFILFVVLNIRKVNPGD